MHADTSTKRRGYDIFSFSQIERPALCGESGQLRACMRGWSPVRDLRWRGGRGRGELAHSISAHLSLTLHAPCGSSFRIMSSSAPLSVLYEASRSHMGKRRAPVCSCQRLDLKLPTSDQPLMDKWKLKKRSPSRSVVQCA